MSLTISIVALSLVSVLATNTSCPTWFYYDNSTHQCQCGFWLSCLSNTEVEIADGFCATSAGEGDQYYIGDCPFRHTVNNTNRIYSEMPADPDLLDDVMCGPYNRKGLLCGRCIDGYGPTAHILDLRCANCSKLPEYYAIPLYLLLELLPITLLFICVTIFNFNITSGPLLGYIIFCQVCLLSISKNVYVYDYIISHVSTYLQVLFKVSVTLSQCWSFQYIITNVIPPFCISEKLNDIDIQLLCLVPATYQIVLVIVTYILIELHARNFKVIQALWKPFSIILKKTNIKEVNGDAVIHAFASFIFLSNVSVYVTMGNVTAKIMIYRQDLSTYKHSVFFDPSLEWLSHKHIEYLSIGLIPFVFLTLFPSVFHIIYPTRIYGYISRCISARKRLAITTFAEALQVCFKDGLNGTRDYRALAGLITLFQIIYSLSRELILTRIGFSPAVSDSINYVVTCCIITYIQPCKSAIANVSLSFNLLLLGVLDMLRDWWFNYWALPTETQNICIHLYSSDVPRLCVSMGWVFTSSLYKEEMWMLQIT